MTNFIPIYPLDTIAYPNEIIKFKADTPQYIQLIKDTAEDKNQFGLQVILGEKHKEYGTLMEIIDVKQNTDDKSLSIEAKGIQVFRVLEIIHNIPEKLYAGAIVSYPENDRMKVHPNLANLIFNEVKNLYEKLHIENVLPKDLPDWNAYDIAHKLGLTHEQEYELLIIFNEVQRMEYLRRFFNSIMPEVYDLDLLKSRLNLN